MSDYRALYRKWRPETFDDVCGQDAITDILKYEIANDKLSHAYLFADRAVRARPAAQRFLPRRLTALIPRMATLVVNARRAEA